LRWVSDAIIAEGHEREQATSTRLRKCDTDDPDSEVFSMT
jgi:hypothetical protein